MSTLPDSRPKATTSGARLLFGTPNVWTRAHKTQRSSLTAAQTRCLPAHEAANDSLEASICSKEPPAPRFAQVLEFAFIAEAVQQYRGGLTHTALIIREGSHQEGLHRLRVLRQPQGPKGTARGVGPARPEDLDQDLHRLRTAHPPQRLGHSGLPKGFFLTQRFNKGEQRPGVADTR